MKYLVTGATGGYGTYALGFLKELVPISDIAVLARTEEKAAPLKAAGFDVRLADYSDLTALEQVFTGIDRLLFVSGAPGNRQAEHQNVVDAAEHIQNILVNEKATLTDAQMQLINKFFYIRIFYFYNIVFIIIHNNIISILDFTYN